MTDRGPPEKVEPETLWAWLTTTPRPMKVVEYPRKGAPHKTAIVPLTQRELQESRIAAEKYTRDRLKDKDGALSGSQGYQDVYRNACITEYLVRACRSTLDIKLPAFPSAADAEAWLFPDELAVLMDACTLWQAESGPILSYLTDEETEAWIAKLAEGGSRVPLALLSSAMKDALLMHTVSLLHKLRTANTSPGSPQGGSSTLAESLPQTDLGGPVVGS